MDKSGRKIFSTSGNCQGILSFVNRFSCFAVQRVIDPTWQG